MKKYSIFCFLLVALLSCLTGCKKSTTDTPVTNIETLPPITQNGANTFGCLLNGKIWLPKGFDGNFTNSRINIDPTFMDGDLTVRVYRIIDGIKYTMTISSDSIKSTGTYLFKTLSRAKFRFGKYKSDLSIEYCNTDNGNLGGNPNNVEGFIKITRYDLVNRIFSGEFELAFNNDDCGYGNQIKLSGGRFDYKL